MPSEHASAELLGALSKLLSEVTAVPLRLDVPGVEDVRRHRSEVVDQLSDYVIPRLVQLEAPLLTVVGGSTGAGKSTLVNSILGERVTESGVLRPTTRSPVLVHHPDDAEWFQPDRILPDMPRTLAVSNDVYALRLAASPNVPRGLAVLDAPDIDSIDQANRELASQLLAAADLWLFVTSAARYADQVPWDYLRLAAERSTSVAVVLDRTHDDALVEVRGHLARMMTSRGLSDSPLFTVPESPVDGDGLLPAASVAAITTWLHELAGDPSGRAAVVFGTLDGAVRHNVKRCHAISDAMVEQVEAAEALTRSAEAAYRAVIDAVGRESADASVLRGEVLTRWQEFVGSGDLARSVEDRVSRIRARLVDGVTGKRTRSAEVAEAIATGVQALVVEHAESAATAAAAAWSATPAGASLVGATRGLDRASREVGTRAERLVRDWQAGVVELVRSEAADKRRSADFLAFGTHGVGVSLMVLALGHRAGNETAGLESARSVLTAVFGAEAATDLARRAHADLEAAVTGLLEAENRRFTTLVGAPEVLKAAQVDLREATRRAEYARHTDFLDGETAR